MGEVRRTSFPVDNMFSSQTFEVSTNIVCIKICRARLIQIGGKRLQHNNSRLRLRCRGWTIHVVTNCTINQLINFLCNQRATNNFARGPQIPDLIQDSWSQMRWVALHYDHLAADMSFIAAVQSLPKINRCQTMHHSTSFWNTLHTLIHRCFSLENPLIKSQSDNQIAWETPDLLMALKRGMYTWLLFCKAFSTQTPH